jgi:hypothetical protein
MKVLTDFIVMRREAGTWTAQMSGWKMFGVLVVAILGSDVRFAKVWSFANHRDVNLGVIKTKSFAKILEVRSSRYFSWAFPLGRIRADPSVQGDQGFLAE